MITRETRLGIFGGTFNPVHIGHLRSAEEIRELFLLDKILFIPTKSPPLKAKDPMFSDAFRMKLLKEAVKGNPHFAVNNIEYRRKGVSFTLPTIKAIRNEMKLSWPPYFIVGSDAFLSIRSWWKYKELLRLTNFIVLNRPGGASYKEIRCIAEDLGFRYNKNIGSVDKESYNGKASQHQVIVRHSLSSAASAAVQNRIQSQSKKNRKFNSISKDFELQYPAMTSAFESKAGTCIHLVEVTPLDVSSTEIRERLRSGNSVRYLVPQKVYQLLKENAAKYEK